MTAKAKPSLWCFNKMLFMHHYWACLGAWTLVRDHFRKTRRKRNSESAWLQELTCVRQFREPGHRKAGVLTHKLLVSGFC